MAVGASPRRAARSLLAAALLATAAAADAPPSPLELTSTNFDDAWKAHDLLLVEFYWNGSEAHAALNATLPAALALAVERGAAATLARVDAEREPRLRKRFRVPAQGPRHDRSALRLFRREQFLFLRYEDVLRLEPAALLRLLARFTGLSADAALQDPHTLERCSAARKLPRKGSAPVEQQFTPAAAPLQRIFAPFNELLAEIVHPALRWSAKDRAGHRH